MIVIYVYGNSKDTVMSWITKHAFNHNSDNIVFGDYSKGYLYIPQYKLNSQSLIIPASQLTDHLNYSDFYTAVINKYFLFNHGLMYRGASFRYVYIWSTLSDPIEDEHVAKKLRNIVNLEYNLFNKQFIY